MNEKGIYFLDPVEIQVGGFSVDGYVLDIGGGGEGIIGSLNGLRVVAIDCRNDELAEAPEGPLKIVMDARDLKFLDSTFSAATAFFSLMYFREHSDLQAALAEAFRVLKPGGCLRVWDVHMATFPRTEKRVFAVRVKCFVDGRICKTAYGAPWPPEIRDSSYYRKLAESVGFEQSNTTVSGCSFYTIFRKHQ